MSRRSEKVASTIQQELAQIIMRELSDPRLSRMVSITRVKVADDLSSADVFVSIMGTPGQQTAALNALKHSAGLMRTRLTKQMTLRIAPFLKFHIDENLQRELAMLELLAKVAEENAEIDRRRTEAGETEPVDVTTGGTIESPTGETAFAEPRPGEPDENMTAQGESVSDRTADNGTKEDGKTE